MSTTEPDIHFTAWVWLATLANSVIAPSSPAERGPFPRAYALIRWGN